MVAKFETEASTPEMVCSLDTPRLRYEFFSGAVQSWTDVLVNFKELYVQIHKVFCNYPFDHYEEANSENI